MFVFGSGLRLGVDFVNPASPGWGLGWVCLGTVCGVVPLVSAVCGVRGWGSVSACLWDVCGLVRAPLAPRRFRFRRAVWACVLGPGLGSAQPFLAGFSGCVFCALVVAVVAGMAVPGGAGAAVAGAGGGGRVRAEGGTGGGGGHGAAVARLVASGGAGVVVAGAGGGGWVWAAGGTGSPAGPVGGG